MSRGTETAPAADWTFVTKVHFKSGDKGRKRLRQGSVPPPVPMIPGRVPRITRLVALAHRFAGLIESGDVADYADLARLSGVTRARITQIMNLLHLAPDIQEALLDLPRTVEGRDPYHEREVRPIAAIAEWKRQQAMWLELNTRTKGAR